MDGPYDGANAVISIYAGAGGVDAHDWAEMLERMYIRFAGSKGYVVKTLDRSAGAEAGIKGTTLLMQGAGAYGTLRSEHGTHRLVRLSPFNADKQRHTSFANVEVMPELAAEEVRINDNDLRIDVYRSKGHGGQSVNTTDSAVRITHIPSGFVVTCQNERSQWQNKEYALKILRARLAKQKEEEFFKKQAEIKGARFSASWGNQVRSYILHPYQMVRDERTGYKKSNVKDVLEGELDPLIESYKTFFAKEA